MKKQRAPRAAARAPITIGAWRDLPAPDETPYTIGAWQMAKLGSAQHASAVRGVFQGANVLGVGGVVEIAKGDGIAFVWQRKAGLPLMAWRRLFNVTVSGLWNAHHRGIRRISAVVIATHEAGLRFIKRLGFVFAGIDTGYAGATEPMLRYVHCWPAFERRALVDHQLRETERACLAAWCPCLLEGDA